MSAAVYGIGNILMGDDGIGPAVARFLADRWTFDDDVVIEDLGTPSLDLPGYLIGHDLVVLVDAVASDGQPGALRIYRGDEIVAVPPGIRISPHEPSVNDALAVLAFADKTPADVVLVGVVPETLDGGVQLSPAVADAVTAAADAVVHELADHGHKAIRK